MKEVRTRRRILTIVGIILALVMISPFLLVVINTAKESTDIVISPITLPDNWGQILANMSKVINNSNFSFWSSFGSSLFITAASLILLILFSSMAAWVLCRNEDAIWSKIIFMFLVAAMVIPFQVVMLPILTIFREIGALTGLQMLQSFKGIIFAYVGFGCSMTVFIIHGFIKGIPRSLEEAARIDGCPTEGIFFYIIMPMLRPVHMTVLILNGLWIWNDYLLPSLLLGLNGKIKTLPVAVTSFVGSYVKQCDLILTAALLAMIPIIILFLVAQKQIIQGVVDGAVK